MTHSIRGPVYAGRPSGKGMMMHSYVLRELAAKVTPIPVRGGVGTLSGGPMACSEVRSVVLLRSTAKTGHTHVTRKNRRNHPDRLELRKFDPAAGRHVVFRGAR